MTNRLNYGNVTAMILAGGLGTRLRSVVADRPKVLAPVLGRPFLFFLLDQLCAVSVRRVVLLTGYRSEQVEQTVGRSYQGMTVSYSSEDRPLGTGGAPRAALELVSSNEVLLMNGDSYCTVNLKELLSFHRKWDADLSMALAWSDETRRFGRVRCNSDRRLTGFCEKGVHNTPGWINAGVYLLKKNILEQVPAGLSVSLEKEIIPEWMKSGKLLAYTSSASVLDIGTPESYDMADAVFRRDSLGDAATAFAGSVCAKS